ncbi:MAG: NTP transferase domain-containing protein [Fimbriimonadales bacterium]
MNNTTARLSESAIAGHDAAPKMSTDGFAVIVLAAGMSPGKGRPKQLVPYLGRTLVEHAARTALASGACEVVVVAGDHHDEIRRRLQKLPVRVVHNRDWAEGMASSIRAGLSRLRSQPRAAILSLCDQPRITSAHLRTLGERVLAADGPAIVASSYDGISGAPCAFTRSMFPRLLELRGAFGARHLIRKAGAQVEAVGFAEANDEVEVPDGFQPILGLHREDAVMDHCKDSWDARAPPSCWRGLVLMASSCRAPVYRGAKERALAKLCSRRTSVSSAAC